MSAAPKTVELAMRPAVIPVTLAMVEPEPDPEPDEGGEA